MFRASQTPPQPKTMRQTKYLDPKAFHEKKYFFCRKHFFVIFLTFSKISKSGFSRFWRCAWCFIVGNPIQNGPVRRPKSLCDEFFPKIDSPDGSISNATGYTDHQNGFYDRFGELLCREKFPSDASRSLGRLGARIMITSVFESAGEVGPWIY